jgi:hypothetical protein
MTLRSEAHSPCKPAWRSICGVYAATGNHPAFVRPTHDERQPTKRDHSTGCNRVEMGKSMWSRRKAKKKRTGLEWALAHEKMRAKFEVSKSIQKHPLHGKCLWPVNTCGTIDNQWPACFTLKRYQTIPISRFCTVVWEECGIESLEGWRGWEKL